MSDLDFIEEIRVAQYWRKQLGEMEYVQRNPEDLHRWYVALETRGPDEIRAYLAERASRYPPGEITGIVSKPPHPTREIIDIWLASHHRSYTANYWYAVAAFIVASFVIMPNLSGCQGLHNPNKLATNPPQPATLTPGTAAGSPQPTSTMPANFPAPAHQAGQPLNTSGPAQ